MSLRNYLIERARSGDAIAVDLLCRMVPQELPAAALHAARDDAIRAIAASLAVVLPDASRNRLARLLAASGAALDTGAGTAARVLPMLTGAERAEIEAAIRSVWQWLPQRRDGTRWPKWRHIFDQIADFPVERANTPAPHCRHERCRA
jgi:hypothetical protein